MDDDDDDAALDDLERNLESVDATRADWCARLDSCISHVAQLVIHAAMMAHVVYINR